MFKEIPSYVKKIYKLRVKKIYKVFVKKIYRLRVKKIYRVFVKKIYKNYGGGKIVLYIRIKHTMKSFAVCR